MQAALETAEFLGAKLTRDAIWADNRCNWFGWPVTELRAGKPIPAYRMCGPDFQNGTSGIAFFLAHLYSATGENLFRMTAESAMRHAFSRLDDVDPGKHLSFQTGLVGIAYALLALARTCEIEKFNSIAFFILEEICEDDSQLETAEVDSEAISALLGIYRDHPKDFILQTALALGEKVIKSEAASPTALLDLFQRTGNERFRHKAEEQLAGDIAGNLCAADVLKDHCYVEQARSGLDDLIHNLDNSFFSPQLDFSLGAGLAAQADVLIEARRVLNDVSYFSAAVRIAKFGMDRYRKDNLPWPCASPEKAETPGLMNGLAGIGYMYLRVFDSVRSPSLRFLDQEVSTTLR